MIGPNSRDICMTVTLAYRSHSSSSMKLLLAYFISLALCFCAMIDATCDLMELDSPVVVESDLDLVRVLIWSIEQGQEGLRDEMMAALLQKKDHLAGVLNSETFRVVCVTLGLMDDEEFWFQHLQHHLLSDPVISESLCFFKMLIEYPYSSAKMLVIEELCVLNLKSTLDEKFLRAMMDCESLPVMKEFKALSAQWYDLLQIIIAQGNFKLFRMIIADWWNFKVRTNLGNVAGPGSKHCYYKEISLLAEALANDRADIAWLLSGRTWYFYLFKHPLVRNSPQFRRLSTLIPELAMISWNAEDFNTQRATECYIEKITQNYPDYIHAQCLVLTSSFCPHDIKGYIMGAIKNHHVDQVIAAAKCDKLLPEHLHLVHVAGDDFKCAYNFLNGYLGAADITSLQFHNCGRVVLIIILRENLFMRRALRLLDWYIAHMGSHMTYTDILEGLVRVYALDKLEKEAFDQLKIRSAELANGFLADPAFITETEATELLQFYREHQYSDFAFELLARYFSARTDDLLQDPSDSCAAPSCTKSATNS